MNVDAPNPATGPSISTKRLVFKAALVGAMLPRLVSVVDGESVHLPGQDWLHTLGWLLVSTVFALAAAWVAANVWREQDAQRAFALGLSFLYVVTGGATDVQKVAKVAKSFALGSADAQQLAQRPQLAPPATQVGTIEITVKAPPDSGRIVTFLLKPILATGEPASQEIRRVETNSFPVTLDAPPGRYLLDASAPNLIGSKTISVEAGKKQVAEVELHKNSAFWRFIQGAKGAVFNR